MHRGLFFKKSETSINMAIRVKTFSQECLQQSSGYYILMYNSVYIRIKCVNKCPFTERQANTLPVQVTSFFLYYIRYLFLLCILFELETNAHRYTYTYTHIKYICVYVCVYRFALHSAINSLVKFFHSYSDLQRLWVVLKLTGAQQYRSEHKQFLLEKKNILVLVKMVSWHTEFVHFLLKLEEWNENIIPVESKNRKLRAETIGTRCNT